jgi:hypothetical protein
LKASASFFRKKRSKKTSIQRLKDGPSGDSLFLAPQAIIDCHRHHRARDNALMASPSPLGQLRAPHSNG